MAKKLKSFSHVQVTEALEQLGRRGTSAQDFVYDLLRVFPVGGNGQVRRTKDGVGNSAKDGLTVLVIAYAQKSMTFMKKHRKDFDFFTPFVAWGNTMSEEAENALNTSSNFTQK